MGVNINCIYNYQGAWCINKGVKRSIFGIGARCCIDYPYKDGCKLRESHPRPRPSPPAPQRKKQ